MTVDRIWHILGKKFSGDASEEELNELEQLLRNHPELYYPIQNITDLWKLGKPVDGTEARQALQRHLLRLEETTVELQPAADNEIIEMYPRKRKNWLIAGGVAASVAIFLASYFLVNINKPTSGSSTQIPVADNAIHRDKHEVSTQSGAQSRIILPDGSTVWLNAGSKIEYDKSFDSELREVSLSGEAYFDVTKNPKRPFIIHTKKIDIKVLGTAFNVKSYAEDAYSETSLIHGSIEVTMKDKPDEKIIMKPSQKLVVMNDAVSLLPPVEKDKKSHSTVVVDTINYLPSDGTVIETSWMTNRFIFREKKFVDLAHEMERKYSMKMQFEDEEVAQLMFNGNFKNETLEQVLQALQLANYFHYSIKNNTIIVTK